MSVTVPLANLERGLNCEIRGIREWTVAESEVSGSGGRTFAWLAWFAVAMRACAFLCLIGGGGALAVRAIEVQSWQYEIVGSWAERWFDTVKQEVEDAVGGFHWVTTAEPRWSCRVGSRRGTPSRLT